MKGDVVMTLEEFFKMVKGPDTQEPTEPTEPTEPKDDMMETLKSIQKELNAQKKISGRIIKMIEPQSGGFNEDDYFDHFDKYSKGKGKK